MSNILYITAGQKLKKAKEFLVIEKDGVGTSVHLDDVTAIVIESRHCSITVDAHCLCSQQHVPLIICNEKHHPEVFTHSMYSYYQLTKHMKRQIEWDGDSEAKTMLAAQIIRQKIQHQKELLMHLGIISDKESFFEQHIQGLSRFPNQAAIESSEAVSARVYFRLLFGKDFRRMEDDLVNAGLNYGYMLVRAVIMTQVVAKGLHPSLGIWHHSQFNNYNLADDIIEVFRPMVDYVVVQFVQQQSTFDKDCRMMLQQVLLQQFAYKGMQLDLPLTIAHYLDEVIQFFDQEQLTINLPVLDVNKYEYQR